MTDTPNASQPSPAPPQSSRRRLFRRAALGIGALFAAVATGIGITALAEGGPRGWHRGGFMGAAFDPARLDQHLDRMLRHLYVEIDATEEQKAALDPIVKAAARDLVPVHTRMRDARRQAVALLAQQSVDRAALETLRAEHVALMEQGSKRLTQALADVADVLTPEQRRELAERVGRRHGRRG